AVALAVGPLAAVRAAPVGRIVFVAPDAVAADDVAGTASVEIHRRRPAMRVIVVDVAAFDRDAPREMHRDSSTASTIGDLEISERGVRGVAQRYADAGAVRLIDLAEAADVEARDLDVPIARSAVGGLDEDAVDRAARGRDVDVFAGLGDEPDPRVGAPRVHDVEDCEIPAAVSAS